MLWQRQPDGFALNGNRVVREVPLDFFKNFPAKNLGAGFEFSRRRFEGCAVPRAGNYVALQHALGERCAFVRAFGAERAYGAVGRSNDQDLASGHDK